MIKILLIVKLVAIGGGGGISVIEWWEGPGHRASPPLYGCREMAKKLDTFFGGMIAKCVWAPVKVKKED